MRRRPRTTFIVSILSIITFASFSLYLSRNAISTWQPYSDIPKTKAINAFLLHTTTTTTTTTTNNNKNVVESNSNNNNELTRQTRRVSSVKDSLSTVSVLIPDWEILVIVVINTPFSPSNQYYCLFPNKARSLARFSGVLPFTNRSTFKCDLPESVRRHRLFSQPTLVTGTSETELPKPMPQLIKWNFLVFESFSTENDIVVFAKGVNHRNGYDRSPEELRCVFDFGNGVHSAVTSSVQEVFRCPHPDFEPVLDSYYGLPNRIGISLEIVAENIVVPSVAYYSPRSNPKRNAVAAVQGHPVEAQPKYELCACTMVYNVAKFLREWVMYHSKVGVDNFLLYDNGSDDDLYSLIRELRQEGYNISTVFWIWPKTQEAGFSHSVVYSKSKGLCKWIMYVDVDEFVFSPSWVHESNPSLKSLLPQNQTLEEGRKNKVGQVSMKCLEFGPSGRGRHPEEGVTQGYTCRMRTEQRHKSMVLVDAVDPSLRNVIHHFEVNEKEGFVSKPVSLEQGLVNHYKYQAWDEFKNKFRRRVSAYVVDWKQELNPTSKDRTPGLGFKPIEPNDWTHRFCEVRDLRLKFLTRKWFRLLTPNGYTMAWQNLR
ncbi:glycosyltransferase family 92 protein At1g27200 [Vigna unguiculata]|uniref:Glycosyltransferase family 92 protein n=2 Tax=Vigna unguiculata TaxID=3917 RepID=A0A4D6NUT8_VIGUN|nr:glycosyltransferase family 92 protein At1g27200 [Vigna unguiculata]QCE16762.1 Glycosyltransferase family 92 [Vigna unguiculata]